MLSARLIIFFCLLVGINLHAGQCTQLFQLGNDAFRAANYEQAIDLYQQALKYQSLSPIHYNLGMAYQKANKPDPAINSFTCAIALDPNYTMAHLQLAIIYQNKGKIDKAIEHFERVLALDNKSAHAHRALAQIYLDQEKLEQSLKHVLIAHELCPNDFHITFEAANTLNVANKLDSALALYHELLAILPNQYSILYNTAYTLKKMGRMDEALEFYKKSLAQKPDYVEAQFSLGLAYLAMGDFEKGWCGYQWRLKKSDRATYKTFSEPLIDIDHVAGKTVLLHAEQGLGDTFQFIRYGRFLKNKGARVIAVVQSPLVKLLALCPYLDQVLSVRDAIPSFDMQAPLLSLPYLCNTTIATIPEREPYLYADERLVAQWHETLSKDTNFKVGICWQGNPNYSTQYLRLTVAAKSVAAATFAPLAQIPGVSLYSLQRETGTTQVTANSSFVRLFGADFDSAHGRFMDTAAVMKNLDLVITVDTSTAHLAAGLGVPVWVLIPNPPDWRWMLERPDSPWYPTMRLFRQPAVGDWQSVMHTITQELEKLVQRVGR